MLTRCFKLTPEQVTRIQRIVAFLVVVGISVAILVYREQVQRLGAFGYPGIFLFSVLTSATVILPAPGLVLVFAMGAVLNPIWVALVAGTGATIGELSAYVAGYSGKGVIGNVPFYQRIHNWMETHPHLSGWFIFVLAVLPVPFFDLAGIAAGALGYPVSKYFGWSWMGKVIKMLVVALLGDTWFKAFPAL